MRAVVVGAGLGGLAAALRLQGLGADVTVVEQREDDFEAGPGLSTHPGLTGPAGRALVDDVVACRHQLGRVQVVADPLADFDLVAAQRHLADGTPIADASTAGLLKMAQMLPSNNIFSLLSLVEAIKSEPFDPAEAVPHMPMLLVAVAYRELNRAVPD